MSVESGPDRGAAAVTGQKITHTPICPFLDPVARALQVAYNADRRRQLWEQTARDDLKELNELREIVRAEQEKAEAKKKEAHARGAEVQSSSFSFVVFVAHHASFGSAVQSIPANDTHTSDILRLFQVCVAHR